MTTTNLNIPDSLEGDLAKLGHDVASRTPKVDQLISTAKSQQDKIILGASVLFQRKQDEIGVHQEELVQMEEIRARQQALLAAARGTTTPPPAQPTTDPVTLDATAPQAPLTVVIDTTNTPPPAQPTTDATVNVNVFNVRNWTGKCWLFAIIGLLVGLIVARFTYNPLFGDITNDNGRTILDVLWFVFLGGLGFFGGGYIGAQTDD